MLSDRVGWGTLVVLSRVTSAPMIAFRTKSTTFVAAMVATPCLTRQLIESLP